MQYPEKPPPYTPVYSQDQPPAYSVSDPTSSSAYSMPPYSENYIQVSSFRSEVNNVSLCVFYA